MINQVKRVREQLEVIEQHEGFVQTLETVVQDYLTDLTEISKGEKYSYETTLYEVERVTQLVSGIMNTMDSHLTVIEQARRKADKLLMEVKSNGE